MKKVKVMTLSDYNGFTGKEREKYAKKQQKAIKEGILKPEEETKCVICGQDKGIRVYHSENYFPERIIQNSIPMCKSCHDAYHRTRSDHSKFRKHLEKVREIPSKPQYHKTSWLPSKDKVLDEYNGFNPEQREASKGIIAKALDEGKLKPLKETKCSICGQDKGLREYHIEDYSSEEKIINSAKPVCWTCHQYIHHQKDKNLEVFERYVKEAKENPRSPIYIANLWTKDDE